VTACIFGGPSLALGEASALPDVTWLPPARHGDVYRAVSLLRPRAIGIVDGYFQWVPSVWHKEILWALHQGVHVFGAASMGALRAAELAPFGVRGVGRIYEAYRDGVLAGCGDEAFEDDDEVAVVHGPPESGYAAGSEAMVNIRCTLGHAERAGLISSAVRGKLVAIAKRLFFPERTYDRVLAEAPAAGIAEAALAALEGWLPSGRVNQKRMDALAMIEAMREFLASDPPPMRASFTFEHTTLWERAVAALQPATAHDAEEIQALEELRLDGMRFHDLRLEVLRSLLAASEADASDPEQRARRELLHRARDEIPPLIVERQILARIRASGEYAKLLARAHDKRARLASRVDLPRAVDFSELQLLQLRDWYFSKLSGADMPDDLERYLRDSGYPDATQFHEAIFAEYVYRQMAAA
jgi:hypothetical protein